MAGPLGLVALRRGRGAVDLSSWRKLLVAGGEARKWLNDLITADIGDLEQGLSLRSLLLTPTGRIRADFTVAAINDGFMLIQDSEQPQPLLTVLDPYVLSSDVRLEDTTRDHSLLAVPSADVPPQTGAIGWRPSTLGPGFDVLGDTDRVEELLPEGFTLATLEALEAWRIENGQARFGVDLLTDSLPQEAGWDHLIGYTKGCFLGQESMARVRNLGHPPFVVIAGVAAAEVGPGDVLLSDDAEVGLVTSATRLPDGQMAVIARVRWPARNAPLVTASGAEIRPR